MNQPTKIDELETAIECDDEIADRAGQQMIEAFGIKRHDAHASYFMTKGGMLTPKGIARILFRKLKNGGSNAGFEIASYLELERVTGRTNQFQTTYGFKTYRGIALVTAKIITEEAGFSLDTLVDIQTKQIVSAESTAAKVVDGIVPSEYVIQSKSGHGFWKNGQGWVNKAAMATQFSAVDASKPTSQVGVDNAEWAHVSQTIHVESDESVRPV